MTELRWWQKAVFYQIYPRSFADSNGDGIGDIQGIIDRLDYLQSLGIDAIWLSPHYLSPCFDWGYDISDYTAVAPEYGMLDDFTRFLQGVHGRGIRVILDLVLNHTSHQHPWFVESRSSRDNPKRDWYIWRDGEDKAPPNNWVSLFGGQAWEYDGTTNQYYYHFFLKEQPDLNWRNAEVKETLLGIMRFWLDLGVDGFRLDAIETIFEDPRLLDHTAELSLPQLRHAMCTAKSEEERARLAKQSEAMFQHQPDQPETHKLMQELRGLVGKEYPDRVLVGETDKISYYGDGKNELHLIFNFPLMNTQRLTSAWVRANQKMRLQALPPHAWPCNTLGNHDSPRVYSHYGNGRDDEALARLSLALMLTLRGTPFLYNGEEIGMTDLLLQDISKFQDTVGILMYHDESRLGAPPAEALGCANRFGRDKNRTPMQWADAPNAGFSPVGVQTWLPVNPNYAQGVNVANQSAAPNSLLNFYRSLLRLRKQTPALTVGYYTQLHEDAEDYLAFLRTEADGQTCLVILNMSNRNHTLSFDLDFHSSLLLFSSRERDGDSDNLSQLFINSFEIYIGELSSKIMSAT